MYIQWAIFTCFLRIIVAQNPNCDFYQAVVPGNTYQISSPGYPANYTGAQECRWIGVCPDGYNCRLDCLDVVIPSSTSCMLDRLLISKSGDPQLSGADTYCGRGTITAVSTGQRISIGLIASRTTPGGRFTCNLTAQRSSVTPQCRCGERRQNRIVGGEETGVNEYKMMAGLADVRISQIKCGGVIISDRHVLTAAHCVKGQSKNDFVVIVGEHDVTIEDSPATKAYLIDKFVIHSQFTESNYDYDIAIVNTVNQIEFNDRVGPVCLPFKYANNNFAGDKVTILGWGTVFFGGPKSRVLMKADVDVITQAGCRRQEPTVTDRQMCTYTPGKDTCQDDSGGPLLYTDPSTGLLFNVGIASFGRSCASRSPAVNTRVTTLLNWITANTRVNYCVK